VDLLFCIVSRAIKKKYKTTTTTAAATTIIEHIAIYS
jgi:hypothetical protein